MSESKIYYPSPRNPFVIMDDHVVTPICTRGYVGAQIIKLVLEKLNKNICIRNPFGISADPKFVFDGYWCEKKYTWKFITSNLDDYSKTITAIDFTIYRETDEFEKAFGFKRSDRLQNVQTRVMKKMGVTNITGPNLYYAKAIEFQVWNFPTDKQKVFILISMDDKEQETVKKNIKSNDILVVIASYNEVAYPLENIVPFSRNAYTCFFDKIQKYFK